MGAGPVGPQGASCSVLGNVRHSMAGVTESRSPKEGLMAKVVSLVSLDAALAAATEAQALLDALQLLVEPGLQSELLDAVEARVDALTTFVVDGGAVPD
jgi:hypothetical protein